MGPSIAFPSRPLSFSFFMDGVKGGGYDRHIHPWGGLKG